LSPHHLSFSEDSSKSIKLGSNETSSKPSVTKTALSNLLMAKSGGITLHPSSEKPVDSNKVSQLAQRQSSIPPNQWTVSDVCYFLKLNDCATYWESFVKSVSMTFNVVVICELRFSSEIKKKFLCDVIVPVLRSKIS
jgi:hypothetical protein